MLNARSPDEMNLAYVKRILISEMVQVMDETVDGDESAKAATRKFLLYQYKLNK
jgi:hypothetical protein